MYREDDSSVGSTLLGTLFFGLFYFNSYLSGRQSAFKETEEKQRDSEIEELKRQIKDLKNARR